MRQGRRISASSATAVLVVLGVAATAQADPPEWTRTQNQALPAFADFTVESVAVANGGAATVGLGADTPTGRVPAVSERARTGPGWGTPVRLGPATRVDVGPLVARNARGDAVAVWGTIGGPLFAAVRFGGGWGRPVDTGVKMPQLRTGRPEDAVDVAMGADRRARIATLACTARGCAFQVDASAPKGSRWTPGHAQRTPGGVTKSVAWALSSGGHAVVAWVRGRGVFAARRLASDRRWPVRPLRVPASGATGTLSVDVGAGGEAAVAWPTVRGGVGTSVRLGDDAGWRLPRRVARGAGSGTPKVGVGCEGSVVTGWVEPATPEVLVKGATAQGTEGLFTEAREIGTYGAQDKALSVSLVTVLGRSGTGLVAWARAQEDAVGAGSREIGDRGRNDFRGQNYDGGFRDDPPPAFAPDGTGLLVGGTRDGVAFQEFTPGDAVVRCP